MRINKQIALIFAFSILTKFGFGQSQKSFDNLVHAKRAAKNAINLYNKIRLHVSLDYKTPNMVYKLSA